MYLRHGTSAQIIMPNHERIGTIGEITPNVLDQFDIHQPVFVFEIDLDALVGRVPKTKKAHDIPKYPAITRDFTLIIDQALEAQKVINHVWQLNEDLVENVHLFDVFDKDPIPQGKKSISFRITYRSFHRTLEDEAANQVHQKLTQHLLDAFDATLPM
jgi:phenylalanyl-tRNA synthetase beta chain